MGNYDLFKKRLTVFGNTKRERDKNKIQNNVNRKAYKNLSYKEVLINEEPRNLICINVEKLDEKDIKSMPNESFKMGDEVVFADSHWLIIKADVDDEVYMRGTMKRCDTLVRWQNHETLEIIEKWAIDSRPYTTNLNIDKVITSPKKEFLLQFQENNETIYLGVNRRLLLYSMFDISSKTFKPIASVIQAFNPVNTRGIIELNVVEDASYNPAKDNAELMIADYIDPTITVNIIPIPSLLLGDSIQIKYEFYQVGKKIDVIPSFESSNEDIVIVNENGLITATGLGFAEISVNYRGAVGKLNINIVDMQINDRYMKIDGVNEIKHKRESEYIGFIFNNGIKESEKVFWSLDTINLVSPIPKLEIIDDNTVKVIIIDNQNNIDKSFKLICKDELNTLLVEKQILITSLFG